MPVTSPRNKSKSQKSAGTRSKPVKQARKAGQPVIAASPLVEARNSPIHGKGVYALAPIKKGTRILEYLGERISHHEADSRYEVKGDDDGHTFLFIASNRTVIDAGVGGNDARFINHHCDPNCETVIENSRVFIDAIRDIRPGEELGYDYQLTWESTDDPKELALYECRCGARQCRGTMLDRKPLDQKKLDRKKQGKKKQDRNTQAQKQGRKQDSRSQGKKKTNAKNARQKSAARNAAGADRSNSRRNSRAASGRARKKARR